MDHPLLSVLNLHSVFIHLPYAHLQKMSRQAFGVLLKGISAVFMNVNRHTDNCGDRQGNKLKNFSAITADAYCTKEVVSFILH